MVKLIKKKINGSTVIEVIIAMIIIMVVFTIAMKVFANVLNTSVSYTNIRVLNQLDAISKKVEELGYIDYNLVKIDSVDYELIGKNSNLKSILILEIRARQNGKLVGTLKTFIKVKPYAKN